MLSEAYVAGFIDGEGCITINKDKTYPGGKRIYSLYLSVQQVDRRPLDGLRERYGGSLRLNKAHKPNQLWSWTVSGTTAARVISDVLPHLIVKREQAELGLEFQARKGVRGKQATPTDELAVQHDMYERMRILKHIPAEAYLTTFHD